MDAEHEDLDLSYLEAVFGATGQQAAWALAALDLDDALRLLLGGMFAADCPVPEVRRFGELLRDQLEPAVAEWLARVGGSMWLNEVQFGPFTEQLRRAEIDPQAVVDAYLSMLGEQELSPEQEDLLQRELPRRLVRAHAEHLAADMLASRVPHLETGDMGQRFFSARQLGYLGPHAAPAVPALIALLDDEDPLVVTEAAYALSEIGPSARKAVPHLKRLRRHADEDVLAATRHALDVLRKGRCMCCTTEL